MYSRRWFLAFTSAAVTEISFGRSALYAAENTVSLQEGAVEFVSSLADEALSSLTDSSLNLIERRERFRELMHRYFAFNAIAKWVLGRYWRKASDAEKDEYLDLFEKLMVITYADRFETYAGEKLTIEKSELRGEKDALVHSLLERPHEQKPISVIWRVRPKDDSYKIVDVMVEGLSMGITQQKEFSSVIRNHNNKVEGLLSELRKRVNIDT